MNRIVIDTKKINQINNNEINKDVLNTNNEICLIFVL